MNKLYSTKTEIINRNLMFDTNFFSLIDINMQTIFWNLFFFYRKFNTETIKLSLYLYVLVFKFLKICT